MGDMLSVMLNTLKDLQSTAKCHKPKCSLIRIPWVTTKYQFEASRLNHVLTFIYTTGTRMIRKQQGNLAQPSSSLRSLVTIWGQSVQRLVLHEVTDTRQSWDVNNFSEFSLISNILSRNHLTLIKLVTKCFQMLYNDTCGFLAVSLCNYGISIDRIILLILRKLS